MFFYSEVAEPFCFHFVDLRWVYFKNSYESQEEVQQI